MLNQARSLWRLELVRTKWAGAFINWENPLRIHHITTGNHVRVYADREGHASRVVRNLAGRAPKRTESNRAGRPVEGVNWRDKVTCFKVIALGSCGFLCNRCYLVCLATDPQLHIPYSVCQMNSGLPRLLDH